MVTLCPRVTFRLLVTRRLHQSQAGVAARRRPSLEAWNMAPETLDRPYRGGFVGLEHHFALTVYFEDTDAYGIVYYANYLKYMERARSDMLRAVGVDQFAELAASGSAYAVVEVNIQYRSPARLGDDLQI